MVAIPLAMGFAMASGLKPEHGIVGGAIGFGSGVTGVGGGIFLAPLVLVVEAKLFATVENCRSRAAEPRRRTARAREMGGGILDTVVRTDVAPIVMNVSPDQEHVKGTLQVLGGLIGNHRLICFDKNHPTLADPRVRPMGVGLQLYGRRKDGTQFFAHVIIDAIRAPRLRVHDDKRTGR